MDLEIADYERTVKSLHDAVAERDAKLQSLQDEIHCKEQQCASLQKLLGMSSTFDVAPAVALFSTLPVCVRSFIRLLKL